jgi:putative endonuclease
METAETKKRYFPTRGWRVYMLETAKGNFYSGITTDVKHRLEMHNSGKGAKCLRGQLPVRLVWCTTGSMLHSEAVAMEAWLKAKTHEQKKAMISQGAPGGT